MLGTILSVMGGFNTVMDLYKNVGILVNGNETDRILNAMHEIREEVVQLKDNIYFAPQLRGVSDVAQPSRTISDLRTVCQVLEPVQQAIGGKIVSSRLINTPDKMEVALKANPWDVLRDIRPFEFATHHTDPAMMPIMFVHDGRRYIGWQMRGALPILFNCELHDLPGPYESRGLDNDGPNASAALQRIRGLQARDSAVERDNDSEEQLWRQARKSGYYWDYLAAYPSGRYFKEAVELLDRDIDDEYWKHTVERHGYCEYHDYLLTFPNGRHAREARQFSEEEEWRKAKKWEWYWMYMSAYPDGKYFKQAAELHEHDVDNEYWKYAVARDAYYHYAHNFPKGRHIQKAHRFMNENKHWEEAKKDNNYERYIEKYPDGRYVNEAQAGSLRKENSIWQQACDFDAFEWYLKNYPNGRYAGQAQALRHEHDLWLYARDTDDFQCYLDDYPDGRYSEEASSFVEHEDALWEHVTESRYYELYLDFYPSGRYEDDARANIRYEEEEPRDDEEERLFHKYYGQRTPTKGS